MRRSPSSQPEPRVALDETLDFLQALWALDHEMQSVSKQMRRSVGLTARQRLVLRIAERTPDITAGAAAAGLHSTLHRWVRGVSLSPNHDGRSNVHRAIVVVGLALFAGCAHQPKAVTEELVTHGPPPKAAPGAPREPRQLDREAPKTTSSAGADVLDRLLRNAVVSFDYNVDRLNPDGLVALQHVGEVLRRAPALRVRIEGHCDERGTEEYNLMLGHRRASAAAKDLSDLGARPSQLEVISFGDEKPAEPGHDESAWAMNRRDELTRVTQ